jgi:phosphate transport system ATP-binding protein
LASPHQQQTLKNPVTDPETKQETPKPGPNLKLTARNINFFYGPFQALHDISLDIPTNKVTAFIGPSGCGKSTFLRTMNRMNETLRNTRVEGDLKLDGANLMEMDVTDVRRRVGMVFQKSNPFPKTIFDNVAYGLRVNGINKRNIVA